MSICSCTDVSAQMVEDNTPTVTARRRRPTRHMRLRLETAKKLRAIGAKRKAAKEHSNTEEVVVHDPAEAKKAVSSKQKPDVATVVKTRVPKVKASLLASPPVPKAKFRKRQIHKSWLPTHLFHAKRARMTPPSAPLWRFAMPLAPTAKSYRPTYRASHHRGCVAWDASYMSTIGLEGRQDSLIGLLKGLGLERQPLKGRENDRWMRGVRAFGTFAHEREAPHEPIAPVTVIWCGLSEDEHVKGTGADKRRRKVMVRVHPAAFFQLWEEVLRLAKVAKPQIRVEDLRFELGSIELVGPGSTEALLGALWPSSQTLETGQTQLGIDEAMRDHNPPGTRVAKFWTSLAGLTDPALLPDGALLGFDIQDPRLHHPPRMIEPPQGDEAQQSLLQTIASWPNHIASGPSRLFDRKHRLSAASSLPSQKAINRRKALASPGQYPESTLKDPQIPILLFASSARSRSTRQAKTSQAPASWTLLCPWRCTPPIWCSVMYYPLSTGQQPRFGGLEQKRQIAFETGTPWFPADFPGTKAGWLWEIEERRKREEAWRRRPKSKRVNWDKVEASDEQKGELGAGWACDWERLLSAHSKSTEDQSALANGEAEGRSEPQTASSTQPPMAPQKPASLLQMDAKEALALLQTAASPASPASLTASVSGALVAVNLTLLTRGVPQECARVYRLPTDFAYSALRKRWLALLPSRHPSHRKDKGPKHGLPRLAKDAPPHVMQRRLAQSLLQPPKVGDDDYPLCPDESHLIGFVTTGNFNLGEGQGMGIGSILIQRVLENVWQDDDVGRLCIVRNAGTSHGRLARWNIAG